MRLTGELNAYSLAHDVFGKRAIEDMHALYGGMFSRDSGLLGGKRQQHMRTSDGGVHASTEGWRSKETVVGIYNAAEPLNAARWTALQAYRAKGGVALTTLVTEVPGLRGHQEWQNRATASRRTLYDQDYTAYEAAREAAVVNTSLTDAQFDQELDRIEAAYAALQERRQQEHTDGLDFFTYTSAGSGNDPMDRFFNAVTGNMRAMMDASATAERSLLTGEPDPEHPRLTPQGLFLRAQAIGDAGATIDVPEELPHTHTNFQARGADLPSAARALARGYGELLFHPDEPNIVVGQALGARSLDHLETTWARAMHERSALDAGRVMLLELTSHIIR